MKTLSLVFSLILLDMAPVGACNCGPKDEPSTASWPEARGDAAMDAGDASDAR